jgi:hypothetical protein
MAALDTPGVQLLPKQVAFGGKAVVDQSSGTQKRLCGCSRKILITSGIRVLKAGKERPGPPGQLQLPHRENGWANSD